MRTFIGAMKFVFLCSTMAYSVVAFSPSQQHRTTTTRTMRTTTSRITEPANQQQSTQLSVASEVVANGVAAKLKKSRQVRHSDNEFHPLSSNIPLNRYTISNSFHSNAYKKRQRSYRFMLLAYRFIMRKSKYGKNWQSRNLIGIQYRRK